MDAAPPCYGTIARADGAQNIAQKQKDGRSIAAGSGAGAGPERGRSKDGRSGRGGATSRKVASNPHYMQLYAAEKLRGAAWGSGAASGAGGYFPNRGR